MDLEKQLDTVKMSTKIEAAFPGRVHGHFWFYSLIQGALLGLLACVGYFSIRIGRQSSTCCWRLG